MLEPREADIPALFLVLVVLPLVTYILLGKWNESAKKKERISVLAQLAAEEAFRAEAMAAASVIPVVPSLKVGFHECARCFGPATTRCSRCKSVRYCSGKCQIIHWRQGHRQECQQLEILSSNSSPKPVAVEDSVDERILLNENLNKLFYGYETKQPMPENVSSGRPNHAPTTTAIASTTTTTTTVDTSEVSTLERKVPDKRSCSRSQRELLRREDTAVFGSSLEAYSSKSGNDGLVASSEETSRKHLVNNPVLVHGRSVPRNNLHENHKLRGDTGCSFQTSTDSPISSSLENNGASTGEAEIGFTSDRGNILREGLACNDETAYFNSSPEMILGKTSRKSKGKSNSLEPKCSGSPRSAMKAASRENVNSGTDRKGSMANESKIHQVNPSMNAHAQNCNGVSEIGIMKMMGLKKSPKVPRQSVTGAISDTHKRNKVLFPYEEFVKFFQYEVWDLSPRGLLNCGNSCYANAVLQCLTCTKPLIVYLLRKSHSRTCCVKDWCLMCELEHHVMMLTEGGGPLSPNRILLHMRNIASRMGGGSQEDAHEFLRLLVASMQSICLEVVGGEKHVDSRLQETTFIQHTFGGRLRSKVKCLKCHHESERYENIMDLTLEILGWVESLEDALTQFTAAEDLDGENMYRCGRCATYVKARKQLSIHEAPNILTIVLKRFQKGKYGKINKCITFPDMLDMIPFMTGTGDSPPLYMLYGVVVHLDTLNASFSGHYVSYVKDMHGTWLRIDDTEVQPVPISQVMSEGAYILFYSRSCPRPPRACSGKATSLQSPSSARHCTSKTQKSLRPVEPNSSCHSFASEFPSGPRPEICMGACNRNSNSTLRSTNMNVLPVREIYAESTSTEFSDATSSDWSHFTSSDESSFTTESTRDSFSTVDYADFNLDSISSIFNTFYPSDYSSHNSISSRRFSHSKPQIQFHSEDKGFVLDSSMSTHPLDSVQNGKNPKQVSIFSTEPFPSVGNCGVFVKYGTSPKDSFAQTSGHCQH
ncbi:PREDICTED: ubiquitin carboxyl-terminal hydrolase 15-like isoform X2 [Nelumbo nucifera]|uniref:ubiquitinyl hydrolase 1 n=1 Tax=Nelumbo nucifera TaxID=4432 RepID=A0A1U8QBA0_NELNU|nr:PREDICTED: ubiquitin carboxyl-terminal hydrolase 15-like isoform X2 [Nelumbo nucifera]